MLSALSIVITLIYVLRTKGRSQLKTIFLRRFDLCIGYLPRRNISGYSK